MKAPEGWVEIKVEDVRRIVAESIDDKDFRKRLKEAKNRTEGNPVSLSEEPPLSPTLAGVVGGTDRQLPSQPQKGEK